MPNKGKIDTGLDEADEEICVTIFRSIMRARHRLLQIASENAVEFDLHIAEMNVVDILGKYGPLSMGGLSETTFVAPSSTTRTVKKLESMELVRRERSRESERVVSVSLTRKGKALFKQCYPRILEKAGHFFEGRLNNAERARLAKLLHKLAP